MKIERHGGVWVAPYRLPAEHPVNVEVVRASERELEGGHDADIHRGQVHRGGAEEEVHVGTSRD